MGKRGKAIFLTAITLFAAGNSVTINKEHVINPPKLILENHNESSNNKNEVRLPKEQMFLFDYQTNPYQHYLQETPKIKKKKK